MTDQVDFDPRWDRVFGTLDQPDEKGKADNAREFGKAIKEMAYQSRYLDEEDERGAASFDRAVDDVENAGGLLSDSYDEAVARFKDAEHMYEEVSEIASLFLDKFKAVTVEAGKGNAAQREEVKVWCRENLAYDDWDIFLIKEKLIIVIYDEVQRLHFKMRWHG